MRPSRTWPLALALLLPALAAARGGPPPWANGLVAELDRYRQEWAVPGVALAVVKDDRVVVATGLGVKELGKAGKVGPDTQFAIGSNTKAFTTALLVKLALEGKLSLDDHLVDLLPGLQLQDPWITREGRLRDALSHALGYERWAGDLVAWGSAYDAPEVERRLRFLAPRPGGFRTYGYNNWPFMLAARVLEERGGKPWADALRERLLGPMGMGRTTAGVPDLGVAADVATPHSLIGGGWRPIPHTRLAAYAPAAAMYSTANDLARWLRVQLEGGRLDGRAVLAQGVLDEMRTAHLAREVSPGYLARFPGTVMRSVGLGLMLRAARGRLIVEHGGAVDGMFSQVVTVPADRLGIAVVTNAETTFQDLVVETVLDRVLGGSTPLERASRSRAWLADWRKEDGVDAEQVMMPARVADARPPLPLERYAGLYRNEFLGDAVVEVRDGKLALTMPWHPGLSATLEPRGNDVFLAPWRSPAFKVSPVAFAVRADGRAGALRTRVLPFIDPLEYTFERVPE
jgi:CubicO group peptidase (beta-lactamase class C family)